MALLCGRYDGSAVAFAAQPSDLCPLFDLPSNGHIASIRCANYSIADQVLLTGGEDSFACKWLRQSQPKDSCSVKSSTSTTTTSHKSTSKAIKLSRRETPY